jgi:hypothetical protein
VLVAKGHENNQWAAKMPMFSTHSQPLYTSGSFSTNPPVCTEGQFHWGSSLLNTVYALFICGAPGSVSTNAFAAATITGPVGSGNKLTGDVTITFASAHDFVNGQLVNISDFGVNVQADANNSVYTRFPVVVVDSTTIKLIDTYLSATTTTGTVTGHTSPWRLAVDPSVTPVASAPATCTAGEWIQVQGYAVNESGHWCVDGTSWSRFKGVNIGSQSASAAINIPATAARYRFIGLEVSHPRWSTVYPATWNTTSSASVAGIIVPFLVNITEGATDIIFDRMDVWSPGFPSKTNRAFEVNGTRIAVINSSTSGMGRWMPKRVVGNWEVNRFNIGGGRNSHILIENNYNSDLHGIGLFIPDFSPALASPTTDVTIRRNYFQLGRSRIQSWGEGNNGKMYYNRHCFESKSGIRILFEANVCDGNVNDRNLGEAVAVTPVNDTVCSFTVTGATAPDVTISTTSCGASYTAQTLNVGDVVKLLNGTTVLGIYNIGAIASATELTLTGLESAEASAATSMVVMSIKNEIRDVTFRNNTFKHIPSVAQIRGQNVNGVVPLTPRLQRMTWDNNLVIGMNARSRANGGWVTDTSDRGTGSQNSRVWNIAYSLEDFLSRDMTVLGVWGTTQAFFSGDQSTDDLLPMANLEITNSVMYSHNITETHFALSSQGSGASALNHQFPRGDGVGWVFTGNVMCCGMDAARNITGNTIASTGDALKVRRYTHPSNPKAETETTDYLSTINPKISLLSAWAGAGVDFDALQVAQGVVIGGTRRRVTSTTSIISYNAPDSAACTVEYGTSATWGTGTRVSDGGGARNRNVSLTGLTPNTTYYFRALCRTYQPSGSFKTAP